MDLVAPIIPDAQKNKSADLFLEGSRIGFQAAAQFTEMRRRSELAMAEMASRERMSQEDHTLKLKELDLRADLLPYQQDVYDAHAELYRAQATTGLEEKGRLAREKIAFNQQRQTLVNDVNAQVAKLKLNDMDYATKNPIGYAAGVMQFEDMFRTAPMPEIKNTITQYKRVADQQKIPYWTAVSDGFGGWKKAGESKPVAVWQVYKNLSDPATQEQTIEDLKVSGQSGIMNRFKIPFEDGKPTTFERAESKVPPAMLPSSAYRGTTPTELPLDIPPDTTTDPITGDDPQARYQPTETDTLLAQARAAIAKGAPIQAVAKILQQNSIDPSVLFS